jgi:carbon-monoxide dehydrogenase large subunit
MQEVSHSREGKKRRGKGVACMVKSSGAPLNASAEIAAKEDGSFILKVSAVEHGQGVHTILRQIAAEELQCGIESIQVSDIDTDLSPPSTTTSASKTTFFDGNAVQLAAKDLRREILKLASKHLEVSPEDLELNAGKVFPKGAAERSLSITELLSRVPASDRRGDGEVIVGKGSFRLEDATSLDPETGQGKRAASFMMYAAQGVEVEVDLETGQVDVLSMIAAHDVGRAINRKGCEGQIEGALIQGLGTSLFEEMRFEGGALINGNFSDYRIPCTLDMPGMTPMVVEVPIPDGPWGAKGVGEPGLVPTAAAIGNAVFSAIGCQIKALPFNPETVLETLSSAHRG